MDEQHRGDKILHEDSVKQVIEEVLAEHPSSGGGGLRTPNPSAGGYLGGFGVDLTAQKDGPVAGFVSWDEAYSLDDAGVPSNTLVDNSYMRWDPADPTWLNVKQAGWFNLLLALNFNAPLTAEGFWTIGGPLQGLAGDIPVGGGANVQKSMLVFIDADINVVLSLTGDTDLVYAALALIPLFTPS